MRASAARAPQHRAIHVERAEKAWFESADRRTGRTAVIVAVNEEVATPIAVQVANPDIAAKSVAVFGSEIGPGNRNLFIQTRLCGWFGLGND
ncbi:MAG: hypothetical protein R3C05_22965 [Pirellulaceae bacterium]